MARRMEAALPAKVTAIAITITMGSSTGCTTILALKTILPICAASTAPSASPTAPPAIARIAASAMNSAATAGLPAPSAFINPISPRRSKMAVAMAADTASADATSAAAASNNMSPAIRDNTVPSFCATWRICSALECGIASSIWKAIELA